MIMMNESWRCRRWMCGTEFACALTLQTHHSTQTPIPIYAIYEYMPPSSRSI